MHLPPCSQYTFFHIVPIYCPHFNGFEKHVEIVRIKKPKAIAFGSLLYISLSNAKIVRNL